MHNSKHSFVAIAVACGLVGSAANASAGQASNVTITRLDVSTSSTIVGVVLSAAITSPDPSSGTCAGRNTSVMAIDLTTDNGKVLFSTLTAAFLAGKLVSLFGTSGTECLVDPASHVAEKLDIAFVNN